MSIPLLLWQNKISSVCHVQNRGQYQTMRQGLVEESPTIRGERVAQWEGLLCDQQRLVYQVSVAAMRHWVRWAHRRGTVSRCSRWSVPRFLMKISVTSYINNVHPLLNRQLYTTTNELVSCLLPMLNSTLMALKTPKLFSRRIDPEERMSGRNFPDLEPGPYRSLEQRARSDYLNADGKLHKSKHVDLRKEFWDVGIQAIIQVSSIDLDTERPECSGEEWHVQGQMVSTHKCWRRSLRKPPADYPNWYLINRTSVSALRYCIAAVAQTSLRHHCHSDIESRMMMPYP